jgi:hypothetical protein
MRATRILRRQEVLGGLAGFPSVDGLCFQAIERRLTQDRPNHLRRVRFEAIDRMHSCRLDSWPEQQETDPARQTIAPSSPGICSDLE